MATICYNLADFFGAEFSDQFIGEFDCFRLCDGVVRDKAQKLASAVLLVELYSLGLWRRDFGWRVCVVHGGGRWIIRTVGD